MNGQTKYVMTLDGRLRSEELRGVVDSYSQPCRTIDEKILNEPILEVSMGLLGSDMEMLGRKPIYKLDGCRIFHQSDNPHPDISNSGYLIGTIQGPVCYAEGEWKFRKRKTTHFIGNRKDLFPVLSHRMHDIPMNLISTNATLTELKEMLRTLKQWENIGILQGVEKDASVPRNLMWELAKS